MSATRASTGQMESQLRQWGAKLDELVAKADAAGAEAKVDYRKRIEELKSKHQLAQSKLEELRAAGSEKLETLKVGVESAWKELEAAFRELTH